MRKQSVHAGLSLWWIEDELRFSVLLQHGVVMIYDHRAVGVPIGRGADPKNSVVKPKRESRYGGNAQNYGKKDSSQPHSEVGGRCRRHAARL